MCPIFDPYLVTKRKLMNLFPKGEQHPFLYKLSYPIYYLTQFHLLWNPIPPYLRQICWHVFYYGRGPPIHNFVWRIALGLWGHPESEQSVGSKSTQEQSVSMLLLESLFNVQLVHSTISELWACMQCAVSIWCLKFCLLVVLNQLQKPGHCLIQCW